MFIYDTKGSIVLNYEVDQRHNNGRFIIDVTRFLPGAYNYVVLFNQNGILNKETGRLIVTR